MASPFNVFRRNQRVMMVVLTGLSMFAFLFFDVTTMRSGGLPKSLTIAMFAAICAAGLWFVGRRHGKSSEWALWGAVLGAVAAFFFVRSSQQTDAVVRTNDGTVYTQTELHAMAQRRFQANQFAFRASQVNKNRAPFQGFGPADERAMVNFALGRKEAKRLGIALNDDAVNRWIIELTDNKLSQDAFSEILRELNLSSGTLFNILRSELEVRLAMDVQAPPYDVWMDFDLRSGQQFARPKLPLTPHEQWEQFLKLNQKQSLSIVALPVDSFLAKVPDPSETELKEYFEIRKSVAPGPQGQAGFVQPHRVKLAYVAADFVKFESQASAPTDDEIAAYYEANKSKYQVREFPDDLPEDDSPADALDPVNVAPKLPELDDEPKDDAESKPETKPDAESKSETEPKDGEQKADEQQDPEKSEKKDAETKDETSSSIRASGRSFVKLVSATTSQEETSDEGQTEEKKAGDTATEKPSDPPAADAPPADAAAKNEDADADDEAAMEDDFPFPPNPSDDEKEIKYRPLDDDLKDKIREEMLRDRAFAKMGEAVDKALTKMETLGNKYLEAEEANKAKVAGEIAEELKAYAVDNGLDYVETPWMSQLELQTSSTESIGTAVLPSAGPMQFRSVAVVDEVFPRTGQTGPSYFPQRADSRLREKRYAWWKTDDKPQHSPSWSDEGIPDQVRTAWKYEQARKLAEERALALRDVVKSSKDDFAAALAGQTVTGEPGTKSVVIFESPRFSWLTTDMSTPFDPELGDFLAPRRSFINGVDQPGDDFMKLVFEDLGVGESGVAANFPRSVFYLVRVRDRDGVEESKDVEEYVSMNELRSKFASSLGQDASGFATRPYNLLGFNSFVRVQQEWMKSFDARYGVEPDDPLAEAQTASRPSTRR